MKNIKDITISIFAIIGFVTILSSFNNQSEPQVTHGTPESHVWEIVMSNNTNPRAYSINKVTGEVRKYNSAIDKATQDNDYVVMKEFYTPKYDN